MPGRVVIASAFALVIMVSRAPAANIDDFIDYSLREADNSLVLPGRLFVPTPAADPSLRPLILFLHGAGESGSDNVAQVNGNITNLLVEAKKRSAFLYAPQTNIGWAGSTILDRTMSMIERAIAEKQVDPSRIYVTGLSMGGGGVWNMITRYPDQFAAAVPICPVTPWPFEPTTLLGQSIWDFHARNDSTVSVNASRSVISGILSAALEPVPEYPPIGLGNFQYDSGLLDIHYTEFAAGGHGIWSRVYFRQDMYDWMFQHSLVPEPSSLLQLVAGSLAALTATACRGLFRHRRQRFADLRGAT